MSNDTIQFVDLQAQRARLQPEMDAAMIRVLDHGGFIMGPEVGELEAQLSDRSGAAHVVSCSSGTDAIVMALMAWGIGPGDAVYVPSFTFAASAEAVALVGATPVFVDVRSDSFNLDVESLAEAVDTTVGLRPAAVVAVDMFGLPADYDEIAAVASGHGMRLLADGAEGAPRHGSADADGAQPPRAPLPHRRAAGSGDRGRQVGGALTASGSGVGRATAPSRKIVQPLEACTRSASCSRTERSPT